MDNSGLASKSEKQYRFLITVVLAICAALAILPFILLISSSLTDENTLIREGYALWPRKFSLYAYQYLFNAGAKQIFRSYGITIFVTVVGTSISLLIGPMLAWTLSRRDYKRAHILTFLVFFTTLFNGGIVPSYIMWTQLFHVKNTIFGLIFPSLIMNGFYVILYKNYFSTNIHSALVEAARIDGASELRIYFSIVLPISLPILATIGLMVGLGYWNDWTNGLYYISNTNLYSLQQFLKSIIDNISALASMANTAELGAAVSKMPGSSIRMCMAVIGIIPIMAIYPFFQKAFIAGIALGGVKE